MKKCEIDRVEPIPLSFEGVERVTDTAGFEPLEAKIKRFILSGEVARLKAEEFDSYDYKQMMEGIPDAPFDPDDDLEELSEKIRQISINQAQILARKRAGKELEKTPADDVVSETTKEEIESEDSDEK